MRERKAFPYDSNTLNVIEKAEKNLNLRNRNIDKMSYSELVEYVDRIALLLRKQKIDFSYKVIQDN